MADGCRRRRLWLVFRLSRAYQLARDTHVTPSAIPAFVNPRSGSGDAARAALEALPGFEIQDGDAASLGDQMQRSVRDGAERIVVAGGDGTIAQAAAALVGTRTALAVVPGGTLNHFARDHGVPTDHTEAARAAASGAIITTDVGYVNGQLFLNTSSVGA